MSSKDSLPEQALPQGVSSTDKPVDIEGRVEVSPGHTDALAVAEPEPQPSDPSVEETHTGDETETVQAASAEPLPVSPPAAEPETERIEAVVVQDAVPQSASEDEAPTELVESSSVLEQNTDQIELPLTEERETDRVEALAVESAKTEERETDRVEALAVASPASPAQAEPEEKVPGDLVETPPAENSASVPETAEESPEKSSEEEASSAEGTTITENKQSEETLPQPIAQNAKQKKSIVPQFLAKRLKSRRQRIIAASLLLLLLAAILAPLISTIVTGINAYTTYKTVHDRAYSGYQHFLNLKPLLSNVKDHPTSALSEANLNQAERELQAARQDFSQVKTLLTYTPVIQTVKQYLPQYREQILAAQTASSIGVDVADIGLQLTALGNVLGPKLQGELLSKSEKPLITSSDLLQVRTTLANVRPLLTNIQLQARGLSLQNLPLDQKQRVQVTQYLSLLPQLQSALGQSDDLVASFGWLLGADGHRTFLVQPMDRGELRATGGFTGQYGELTVNQGRVAPFSLRNIALLEYDDNSYNVGKFAPAPYRSWWPFANWGLRDSNLSADFPTSAKIAIDLYKKEAKRDVDGVVMLTPFLIKDVLKVIGPVKIEKYGETITAENLEDRLHYYQLGKGIDKQKAIEHITDDDEARKRFTSELASALMEKVRSVPPQTLLPLAQEMLHALKTRDLQFYVTNQQVQGLLEQYGYAGQLDRSTTRDGLYIVQANVSASKASEYVRTVFKDVVQLDQQGGATHTVQMKLIYNQTGPVYGLDTYRDYVRFYVPQGAKLLSGNGFDSDEALCGGYLGPCPDQNVYPNNELICPSGQYDAGYSAPMLDDPYTEQIHPLNKLGKPTNLRSDEPGRAMFGGYVIVPKNCTATVTLSWYVPPQGQSYQLLVQRQAGTYPELNLTVLPPQARSCAFSSETMSKVLQEDTLFALKNVASPTTGKQGCASLVVA